MKLYFETEPAQEKTMTREKGHGRIETREILFGKDINWLEQKLDWVAMGMVKSRVWEKEVLREETRYFITSLADVKVFARQ